MILETGKGAPAPQAANLDRETVERLAALGYVGAPVRAKTSSNRGNRALADPKDKLQIFESVTRGGELINKEQYAVATEALESALREEPTIPQALLLLATCYVELGRKEEAKAKLDLVLKEDPQNIQALIAMANILIDEGKREDVIALCKQTLAADQNNTQAYMLIGQVYMEEQDHGQALPYLEKAFEIQPKLSQNRLNLAACLVGLKQYGRAETLLKEIIQHYPKFPLVHFNLGLLYEEQGKWEEARSAYSEEVSTYPQEFTARFNLGKVLFRLGDRPGYLAEMRKVIEIAPKRAEGYLLLARGLLYEPAELDEIQALVEKGLSLAQTSELKALGYFLLADIYNRKHETEKMSDALNKAKSYKLKKE
jgi:tetratricopeptide (TPR) repeat protein